MSENVSQVTENSADSKESLFVRLFGSSSWSKKTVVSMFVVAFVLSAGLALVWGFVVEPWQQRQQASNVLSSISSNYGNVTVINDKVITFKGQEIANATIEQKALGTNSSAVIVFGNDSGKAAKGAVNVWLDFSSQKSRDFLLINQTLLKDLIESGGATVGIHPVPTGSAFAIYSAEALLHVAAKEPSRTWDAMIVLAQLGSVLDTDSNDEMVGMIVSHLQDKGINVLANEILSGTFSSWILAVGDDSELASGYYPPIVYVNKVELSKDFTNLNDSKALLSKISEIIN